MTDPRLLAPSSSTRRPLTVDGSVELAVLTRSGLDESRHLGAGIVVDAAGSVLREVGDVGASIYPRSCLKPLQALTVMRSGVALAGPQAVLSTASHAGTAEHLAVVAELLARSGSSEDDLLCPPDWPGDRASARRADGARRMAMNCSGKHAAFLLACAENGWDPTTYTDLDHPLQRATRETVSEFTGEVVDHAGVDGCGAPVFATTIAGLARAVAVVAGSAGVPTGTGSTPSVGDPDARLLVEAVLADAWALDGPGRANTVAIDELGLFAKLGAEGVLVMGTLDGIGTAVKILDGNLRAATMVALHLLVGQGAVDADAAGSVVEATSERVLGAGRDVGRIRLSDALVGGRA
ncbi:asparaginase [Frigoribacterium sp. CFBP9039]|uniref:asparaginase n=1 Tax=Frigoribacterium sp. CFBP9029 TaxID=3096541 RepID=UPI002A69E777|nr:asparaginase [Frigoribacterium sp. CFBP9039]MDY0946944.1 asparaginase [Frigoribacterium sp. CFBP9039]